MLSISDLALCLDERLKALVSKPISGKRSKLGIGAGRQAGGGGGMQVYCTGWCMQERGAGKFTGEMCP